MGERGNRLLRAMDYMAGIPATVPAAIFRRLDPARAAPVPTPCRIGLICLGAIGDLLLLSALVNGIHQRLPDCAIELIVSHANHAAVPLIPHITATFQASVTDMPAYINWLRTRKYDILFDSGQWARISSILSSTSGAAVTVGFRTQGQWRSNGYTIKVDHSRQRHEIQNFMALGRGVWADFHGEPQLAIIKAKPAAGSIIYCHMHPASGPGRHLKEWPNTHWQQLITRLERKGHQIRLTGSPADAAANQLFLAKYFPDNVNIRSIAGTLSLPSLAAELASATALISVNTGIMHLGSLAGVPTIGLHGATNPTRWGPIGPACASLLPDKGQAAYLHLGFEYPKNALPAMGNISVHKVLAALETFGISI